jgi:hypothetical protein
LASVGLLDFLRRKPLAAQALVEPRPTSLPTETRGVSGTPNYSGRLQVERNPALRDVSGYGQAGSSEWGEWEEIRRANPWVAAAINFVLSPLQDARLDVEAVPSHPNQALAKAQADLVRWNLTEGINTLALRGRIADGMLTSGFSLWEYAFATTSRPETPGRATWYVAKLDERLPASLSQQPWKEDEAGRLVGVEQSAPKPGGGWCNEVMDADRLLLFTNDRTGRNYAGFSAFRSVWYIAGRIQPELARLIGVTYQREGAGIPVAYADDPSTPLTGTQRAQLEQLMANLVYHENANAVLPAGWKMNWVFSGGANKGHVLDAWKQLGVVVLQQVGAQQLALGTGETGSRSVGEVHDSRAAAYIRKVASILEEGLSSLAERIVRANWPAETLFPRVKLTLKRPELDPKTLVDAIVAAKGAGLITATLADENDLRERLGFSPITDAERIRERALAPPVPPPSFGPPSFARAHAAKCACGECDTLTGSTRAWAAWRPLRASEKRTDFVAIDAYLAGRREAFEARVKPLVVEMLAREAGAITSAMADGDPSEVAQLPLDTKKLEGVIAEYLADVRTTGARYARQELRRDSGEALAEERRTLKAAAEEEDDKLADEAEDEADAIIEAQQKALVRRMTSRLRSELEAEAIDVLRTGGSALEVVTRVVTRQLETGAFKADAGAVVTRIFNVGRDEAARIVGGVQAVERSALLDSKVCDVCRAADGRTAQFGSAEHDRLVPPDRDCDGGPSCRCLLVFIPGGDE